MKFNPVPLSFLLACIALAVGKLTSYSSGFFGSGYTGSPGNNGMTCASCHAGSPVTVAQGGITSNIPATGYIPGQSYTITITAQHPTFNTFGFMLTAETSTGAKAGTWTVTSNETQLTAGGSYVAHTSSGISGSNNSKIWTVQWTAPSPGVGAVTFYASINRANGNFATSGDQIQTASLTVSQASPPPPPPVSVKVDTVIHEVCLNGCNGAIQASYTGGVPPVTLSISGGSFSNLCGGTYWVKATDSIGQTDSLLVSIQSGSNPPTPDIHFDNANMILYTTAQASAYQWFYNNQVIAGATKDTLSLTGMQAGDYYVRVEDHLSCHSNSQVITVTFGNIKVLSPHRLTMYPNPVKQGQKFYLHWNGSPSSLYVYSLTGAMLFEVRLEPGTNSIDLLHLTSGVYVAVVKRGEHILTTSKIQIY